MTIGTKKKWKNRAISVSFIEGDNLNPFFIKQVITSILVENKNVQSSEVTKATILREAIRKGLPLVAAEYGVIVEI